MFSSQTRKCALLAAGLLLAAGALVVNATPAGAAPAPGCVVITFVVSAGQTPIVITPAPCGVDGWQPLTDAAAAAPGLLACDEDGQVDQFPLTVTAAAEAKIGVLFPADTPGAESAITGLHNSAVCAPPTTLPPQADTPTTTTAPPPPTTSTTTAPPVVEVTDAPAPAIDQTVELITATTAAVPTPALLATVTPTLPNTGAAHAGQYATFGCLLALIGGLCVALFRTD